MYPRRSMRHHIDVCQSIDTKRGPAGRTARALAAAAADKEQRTWQNWMEK